MREESRADLERGLFCRVGRIVCAVPLAHVVETMRPLPIEALANALSFVSGIAVIRGSPTLVIDTAALLDAGDVPPTRFVLLRVGERRVALAVSDILDVRAVDSHALAELPPLLRDAASEAVSAIGSFDRELLVVLHAARLLPPDEPSPLTIESAP